MSEEEILKETTDRFTMFPIKYPDIWSCYKNQEGAFWTANEIDYDADLSDWESLTKDERSFIEHILAFFAGADGIVLENLMGNFSNEVQIPEARAFYAAQAYIETVHSETYSQLIEAFVKDPDRKEELFKAIESVPCVSKKANWALKWMDPSKASFATRLVAFAIVEGVFFCGAFCSIFWLKSRGLMVKALGHSNELISRDETMHCNFAITLYNHLKNKLSQTEVHQIFKEAVEIEEEFIVESIPCKLVGMNSDLMHQYIKYVADFWLTKFGYDKLYFSKNPFQFMDMNKIDGKTNFFEKRVSEYNKSHSITKAGQRKININEDF